MGKKEEVEEDRWRQQERKERQGRTERTERMAVRSFVYREWSLTSVGALLLTAKGEDGDR